MLDNVTDESYLSEQKFENLIKEIQTQLKCKNYQENQKFLH